jgi:beta-glucosidase
MNSTDSLTASIEITNKSSCDGDEVVQLYIHDVVGSVTRPIKELKGFKKIHLKAAEAKSVSFTILVNDLSFYKSDLSFGAEPGKFEVLIGTNSRDVKKAEFALK